jgi:hypothetical protein
MRRDKTVTDIFSGPVGAARLREDMEARHRRDAARHHGTHSATGGAHRDAAAGTPGEGTRPTDHAPMPPAMPTYAPTVSGDRPPQAHQEVNACLEMSCKLLGDFNSGLERATTSLDKFAASLDRGSLGGAPGVPQGGGFGGAAGFTRGHGAGGSW